MPAKRPRTPTGIDTLLTEDRIFEPARDFSRQANTKKSAYATVSFPLR